MIKRILSLLISFTILTSCSYLTKKVESLVATDEMELSNGKITTPINPGTSNKKNLFCFEKNKTHLLLEDESTTKFYQPLIPIIFESKSFSFTQKAAMLSLIEMSRRPDVASPSARIQYYLRLNHKNYYFDIKSKKTDDDTKMPFVKGVEILISHFDSSRSLTQIVEGLEKLLPQNMNISLEMESFLQNNKDELLKVEQLNNTFFKGDEVLTKHEYFKRTSVKKLIASYYSDKLHAENLYETSKDAFLDLTPKDANLDLKCNVDINKDNPLREKEFFSEQNKYHYFAMKEGDNIFIAVSSVIIQKPFTNINNTNFLRTKPGLTPLPVCQFKNNLQDLTLFSMGNRNPAQHLKHFISYEIERANSFQSLEELMNFPRHLFLNDPDRILYESKKGRKSQLNLFLTMNFPIYHVDTLGEVFGVAAFNNNKHEERSLVVDERSQARIWCGP